MNQKQKQYASKIESKVQDLRQKSKELKDDVEKMKKRVALKKGR